MFTFLIIGAVAVIIFLIIGYHRLEEMLGFIGIGIFTLFAFLSVLSSNYSSSNIPEGYVKIDNYSYTTETGVHETVEGPFYRKGDTYYKQEFGRSSWIPFGECDYVEVELPGNAVFSNAPTTDTEADSKTIFCYNCGYELEDYNFCPGCGTKIAEK